ncbi:MAG TPA: hypothetical protein VIW21_11710 [Chthoniobacterales bacterium]
MKTRASACVTRMVFFLAALALLLHLVPGGVDRARGQSSRKDDIVFNSRGVPLAGAAIRVCTMPAGGQPCSPLAQIYSDSALTQALANPTTTDGLGNYFFYAAPGKYMIEVSGPAITTKQIPNVILPSDPSSPTFSSVSSTGPINAFSLNLTGNLTVNGSTIVLGNLASGTLNLTNQSAPPGTASTGSVNLYTKSSDKKLYYKDDTGTETGPLNSGGGANPAGNNGDVQSKNGATLQASGLNDNGATLAINRDQQSAGPNPHFDLRAFGGTTSGNIMTCSITAGSATLSCTSNPDFKDATGLPGSSLGHGVVVPLAGALPTIATPGTPNITPNLVNGTTTWNYKVIAEDFKGGLTAATAAGTTTAGSSALGVTSFTITNGTRSGGVTTYTTSVAHNLQPGTTVLICQFGGGACPGLFADTFNGTKTVITTPTSTTFTVSDGNMPDASESTTAQGNVLACNTLTYSAGSFSGAGTLRYWIYRAQGAGSYSLAGVAVGLDPFWVDCGGAAPGAPSYVPATPPGTAQAGYFSATIVSGGGTTTLTLSASAITSASGVTVLHDDTPALLAAGNAAANQGGGTIYIPSAPNAGGSPVFWSFNSLANLSQISGNNNNYITILVNGYVGLNQPWNLRSNMLIQGMSKRNSSFMYPGGAMIAGSSQPLLYINTKTSIALRNLFIISQGAQSTDLYTDNDTGGNGSTGIILENVDTSVQAGAGFARPMVLKGGFDYSFRQVTCDPASGGMLLPNPCIEFTDSSPAVTAGSQIPGRVAFDYCYINNSGIWVNDRPNPTYGSGNGYRFTGVLAETLYTPFLRIGPMGFTTDFNLTDLIDSDQSTGSGTAIVDATGSQLQAVSITGGLVTSGTPPMLLSGFNGTTLYINHPASSNNGNTPWFSVGQFATEINNQPLNARGTGRVTYAMATPGPLSSCVVSAGGAVPVGPQNYSLSAVDYDGNETLVSTPVSVTTTSGNQTVTCALPALPNGAKGFNGYRNAFRFNNGTCSSPQLTGGSLVDTNATGCGNSAPGVSIAGSSFLSSTGLSTYQLRLNGDALTGTSGTGNIAATTRGSFVQGHIPTSDANNNIVDGGISPTNVSDFFNRAAGNLGSEPNSPWTVQAGTLLVTAGGVGGNTTSQNYAVFTGVGFPNDDQTVSATWVKSGTPATQNNVLTLRGSPTALTAYSCGPANTGTALNISKFVSGTFTNLTSQSATISSGDIISFNVTGTSLNCYVNGVPIASASDSSIASGFPGIGSFQVYNSNGANLQWKNWMASPGYVSLQRPQTWSQMQTFSPGIAIGAETVSASPRGPFNVFFPGALTGTWAGESWTLDKAITVTRFQAQAKTAPAGCTTNAVIRVTDGTSAINLTIAAAANDSGAITQNYAAGSTLTVSVQTAAAGCTTAPADANTVMQYRMQ